MNSIFRKLAFFTLYFLTADHAVRSQCCSNSTNLLAGYNPNFSVAGNPIPPGFQTDNIYSPSLGPGYYSVITSRSYGACSATPQYDHTAGNNSGRYLWFDTPAGASAANPAVAWMPYDPSRPQGMQNTIDVTPDTEYVFSVWIRDLARNTDCVSGGAPIMGLRINGIDMAEINLGNYTSPCCPEWIYLCTSWNSGNATQALLQIESRTGNGFTDLGIDDVYFGSAFVNFEGILGEDIVLCANDVTSLSLTLGNATYQWSTGSTQSTITVDEPGIYWVDIQQGGCTGRDSIVVSIDPVPSMSLGDDFILCSGQTHVIVPDNNPEGDYLWQDGTNGTSLSVNSEGIYWLEITTDCGIVRDTVVISFLNEPDSFSLGADVVICDGDSYALIFTESDQVQYEWQDGTNMNPYVISQSGIYWLRAYNMCGEHSDTIEVILQELPQAHLINDTTLCIGQTLILTPTLTNTMHHQWQDGSSAATFMISQPGTYRITAYNSCGSVQDSVQVLYMDIPNVHLGPDTSLCFGEEFILTAISENTQQLIWQDGSLGSSYPVRVSGEYWLSGSNNCGTDTDTISVQFIQIPQAQLGADTTLCNKDLMILDVSTINASYLWNDGSTEELRIVSTPGEYIINLYNLCGMDEDTIRIDYTSCDCPLYIPNTFTPDGNGKNDVFIPIHSCTFDNYQFMIFNRWGENIFKTLDPSQPWDGSRNNGDFFVPDGVYVYKLIYKNSGSTESQELTGYVLLMR